MNLNPETAPEQRPNPWENGNKLAHLMGTINWLRDQIQQARAKADPDTAAELDAFLNEAPLDVDANFPSQPPESVEHMDQRKPQEPSADEYEKLAAFEDRRNEIARRVEEIRAAQRAATSA
jgi:hypothetical protein